MKIEETRLSVLFDGVADAIEASRFGAAARLADSARRFAPHNPAAVLLHSGLLLKTGAAAAAVANLRGRDERESLILRAEAARAAGWLEESRSSCQSLLSRYAVDCVEGLAGAARRLCRARPDRFPGWVGVNSMLRLVGETSARSVVTVESEAERASVFEVPDGPGATVSFMAALAPHRYGRIRVRVGQAELLGSGLHWPPAFGFCGWVVLEEGCLSGEACLSWTPDSPVHLIVTRGQSDLHVRVDPVSRGTVGWSFSMPLGDFAADQAEVRICALLPDGTTAKLAGSPIMLNQPRPRAIAAPGVRQKNTAAAAGAAMPARVNIVVPVYSGLRETLDCLQSVLATMPRDIATLTIVDDASPDPALRAALDALANEHGVTVLRNSTNLGFPGAANRGIRFHPERDVVLLNADAEVFDGWLERLQASTYSADDIGTATPLGEAASIASYPQGAAHKAYTTAEAAEIDRIARVVNANETVDIPVGVGFCLYLRRSCLDEVGDFDEQAFGKGYGEENDLCLRARQHGWRHVAATGVFVRHIGGRSYGPAKSVLVARNSRVINYRYPGYDRLIADFIATDPLRKARRAIDRQRLIATANKPVLLVSLELTGGVKRHVDSRQSTLQAMQHTVLVLKAVSSAGGKRHAALSVADTDIEHLLYESDLARELDELRSLLLELRLAKVEIHHFLGLPGMVLDLVTGLGVAYRVFVHDYAWICPRVSLLNGAGVYCGEPAIAACEACVLKNGSALEEPLSVDGLRKRSARILGGAEQIVAPTEDVRSRLNRHFPELPIEVAAWETGLRQRQRPLEVKGSADGRIRVAMIGAIGTSKGYSILLECARDAADRDLPLDFIVIGYTRDDATLLRTGRVFVTGPYEEDEVAALLERECCDVALFASMTPETWCYTLTHAIESALPIVAFDLGAVRERLRDAQIGVLLPLETPPAAVNDVLLRQARESAGDRESFTNVTVREEPIMQTNHSSANEQTAAELRATVQVITLPVGIYAFTVKSGGKVRSPGLPVPALQVTLAPLPTNGTVEFLSAPTTLDRWLTRSGDVLMIKISKDSAALLLTSLSAPDGEALAIDVQRLDAPGVPNSVGDAKLEETRVRTTMLVHVQNAGDLEYTEGWAGRVADNFWIEAFAAATREPGVSELLEYRGVMYGGEGSSWLSGGALCGSRGAGIPLVGFAIRIREDAPVGFACTYKGRFLRGSVVGPFSDGRLCRSELTDDPLVGIEVHVSKLSGRRAEDTGRMQIAAA